MFCFESVIYNPLPLAGQQRAFLSNLLLPRTSSRSHSEVSQFSFPPEPARQKKRESALITPPTQVVTVSLGNRRQRAGRQSGQGSGRGRGREGRARVPPRGQSGPPHAKDNRGAIRGNQGEGAEPCRKTPSVPIPSWRKAPEGFSRERSWPVASTSFFQDMQPRQNSNE